MRIMQGVGRTLGVDGETGPGETGMSGVGAVCRMVIVAGYWYNQSIQPEQA